MKEFNNSPDRLAERRGHVRWYCSARGYGFVAEEQTSEDYLIHKNVLLSFGRNSVGGGMFMTFLAGQESEGLKVHEILELSAPCNHHEQHSKGRPQAASVPARVKWYDVVKGYGFVNEFGCADDIFVHSETLRSCGFSALTAGHALSANIGYNSKGKFVTCVRAWSDGNPDDHRDERRIELDNIPTMLASAK